MIQFKGLDNWILNAFHFMLIVFIRLAGTTDKLNFILLLSFHIKSASCLTGDAVKVQLLTYSYEFIV